MSAAIRITSCVDCGMDLIGEAVRCPGCHDRHAERLVAPILEGDDDVTTRRPRHERLSWAVVVAEVIGVVGAALVMIFAVRWCS